MNGKHCVTCNMATSRSQCGIKETLSAVWDKELGCTDIDPIFIVNSREMYKVVSRGQLDHN